jgi:sodium transport system permease protein
VLNQPFVVARKELVDHCRDTRSVVSSALQALMGPAIILLVLLARGQSASGSASAQPWPIIAAVFSLMAAFTGAMAVSTDMIAGERERRSLLPLLMISSSRGFVIVGKWLAASLFAVGGLLVSLLAFGAVFLVWRMPLASTLSLLSMVPALLALALFAAALEILVSTLCRNTKEANTYLSMLVFGTMALAMWLAFRPQAAEGWWYFVPLRGHQRLLEIGFVGGGSSWVHAVVVAVQSALLTVTTAALTGLVLATTWRLFRRDEAVYGG